ncbi:hypothetical protein [Methylobacterium sp. NFXW15]|uniref:tetratricopeptide repeat protein n=1 Tax=Methylobacterium sp. NFXW15 TaxID=2819512 RepID=UPI003CEDD602
MSDVSDTISHHLAEGDFEYAEEIARAALKAQPGDLALRLSFADCLAKQLVFDRAIEQCLHVLHAPNVTQADALVASDRLFRCASQLGQPELGLPYLDHVDLRHSPHASDRCWRPRLLWILDRLEEAAHDFERLLIEFPGDPFVSHFLGETMLMLGREDGLRHSISSTSRSFFSTYFPETPLIERMWEGEPLHGRSITVLATGGHGDYFRMAKHIRQLRALGASHIIATTRGRYRALIESAGADEVVGFGEVDAAKQRSDFWVGTFGLIRADLAGGAACKASGYLTPPDSMQAQAIARRMRGRAQGRPCIGLYWHSDAPGGETKSVPLHCLIPLLARDDIHWVILQQGFGLRRFVEAGLDRHATVVDADLPFDDAGALFRELDGLASIDAWPFNLAGAVGTRTWLMAGRILEAIHHNSERDSFLYSDCATIARQPKVGDWPGAIARLNAELDADLLSASWTGRPQIRVV